jgi:hypothetical protein
MSFFLLNTLFQNSFIDETIFSFLIKTCVGIKVRKNSSYYLSHFFLLSMYKTVAKQFLQNNSILPKKLFRKFFFKKNLLVKLSCRS